MAGVAEPEFVPTLGGCPDCCASTPAALNKIVATKAHFIID